MKTETFDFLRFSKLREFVESQVFGMKDLVLIPPDCGEDFANQNIYKDFN